MVLRGKHVLVTGAGKRVARHVAERLLAHDIRLTAHYHRSAEEAEELVQFAESKKCDALAVRADLRDVAQIRDAVSKAEGSLGHVDVLINSASDFFPTPAKDCTEEAWDALVDLNLKGQFFMAQTVGRGMLARGGVIINIGDVNGEMAIMNYAPYSISKAGLLQMTRNLAREWAPKVRVNSVSPGAVLLPESYTEEQRARSVARSLMKRVGSPDDVAEAVLFLIGNDYITGFNLKVDGGRSIA